MRSGDILAAIGLFSFIAILSHFSSEQAGAPDHAAAVAAAIENEVTWDGEFDFSLGNDVGLDDAPLCLASDLPVDHDVVAKRFEDTVVRIVPASECRSRSVEGNFGMFTVETTYFDPKGVEAGHLEVVGVDCANTSHCIVDIDVFAFGTRYWVERVGQQWEVSRSQNRWQI